MGDIPIYERTQLPPGRIGAALPPYELAGRPTDRSGQINLGQTIAGFSGDIFQKLLETRANNEHAEFLGLINTAKEEFSNYVQTHPGASIEDLQKAQTQMFTDIDKAGQDSQTQIAKQNNKNFMLLNRGTIKEQTDGVVAEIVSKQELKRTELAIDIAVARGGKEGRVTMSDLIDKQAESGLIAKDIAPLLKEYYGLKIDVQTIFNSFNNVLANPTEENIELSQNLIGKSGLSEEEKYRLSRTLQASFTEGKQKQTEQYKAYIEQQSAAVGDTISKGKSMPIEQELLPEVQSLTDTLIERQASGDLNSRDDTTYNFIRDNIMTGKYYSQNDLLEAYATGLSTEQYKTLLRENEENKKLSDATKELLGMYNTDITERTDNVKNAMKAIAPKNIPLAYTALYKQKRNLMGEIRSMVLKGESSEKMFTKIAATYTADTEGFWKNWFRQVFTNWGVNDFSNELLEASKWDDRYIYLIELLKSQDEGKLKHASDINLLIEKWERDDLAGSETSNLPAEIGEGFLLNE